MEKKKVSKGNAYAQRILTLILWAILINSMLTAIQTGQSWYISGALLATLLAMHAWEIPKYGISTGKQHGYSALYSGFLTLVFGLTWHRTVDSTHERVSAK